MRHIILSIILLAFFPMAGYADAVKIGGIYYNLVSKAKTAEVTSNPNKYSGSVVIPSSVTYNGTTYTVSLTMLTISFVLMLSTRQRMAI